MLSNKLFQIFSELFSGLKLPNDLTLVEALSLA